TMSQRAYESVLPPSTTVGAESIPRYEASAIDWLSDETNPHLLVVAASNAAVDNVMRLVVENGFLDGNGRKYFPTCTRLGSASWTKSRGQPRDDTFSDLDVERQIDAVVHTNASMEEVAKLEKRLIGLEAEVKRLSKQAWATAAIHAARTGNWPLPKWAMSDS